MGAQGILAGTGELICKAQHRTGSREPEASNHSTAHDRRGVHAAGEVRAGSAYEQEVPTSLPLWGQVLWREGLHCHPGKSQTT